MRYLHINISLYLLPSTLYIHIRIITIWKIRSKYSQDGVEQVHSSFWVYYRGVHYGGEFLFAYIEIMTYNEANRVCK